MKRFFIFTALCAVLALTLCSCSSGSGGSFVWPDGSPTASPSPSVVVPSPSPSVSATPTPPPTPTPTPSPAGREINTSGSFSSSTGAYIDLRVEWTAKKAADSNEAEIKFTVWLDHYRLSVGPRSGASVKIGDNEKHTFSTSAIKTDVSGKQSTPFYSGTQNVAIQPGEILSLVAKASWKYNGTSGGTEIGWIEATGLITLEG